MVPTGLIEQDKTSANLCIVAKSSGAVLFVWRNGAFTYAGGKVALTLEGFAEIKAETKTETSTTTDASTLGSDSAVPICDMSKAAASMCVEYPLSFGTGQVATSVETSCKNGSGMFATSSNCGTTGAIGTCTITQTSENVSISYKYFYYGPTFPAAAALTNCQEDKTESPAEDGETKVWVFTKADGTKVTID
ncbi:MAG TPA: hypothetical protein VE954_12475 [Oligoflexus sp.]|nr:hypothetical protein [Oligoflexus sp.]